MSDLFDFPLLSRFKSDFTKVSYDKANDVSLVKSTKEVVNFDKVTKAYVKSDRVLLQKFGPKSVDGLFKVKEDEYVFVEFKNGKLKEKIWPELRDKAYHSVMLLTDICNVSCSWVRTHVSYVVVYNDKKVGNVEDLEVEFQGVISNSPSYGVVSSTFNSFADLDNPAFDLKLLQNFVFVHVYSLSASQFQIRYKIW